MTINELIKIASSHYDDGLIEQYWDFEDEEAVDTHAGDTLALFLAREIADTYEEPAGDQEKLDNAAYAVRRAAHQLRNLACALYGAEMDNRCATK